MRLWSLHPRQLDVRGLVALWREGLLARKVLEGKTVGYRNHPQLLRFRSCVDPVAALDGYLSVVLEEALRRGYRFDGSKVAPCSLPCLRVSDGQLAFEWEHLRAKLLLRDRVWLATLEPPSVSVGRARRRGGTRAVVVPIPHPCFEVFTGPVEPWERMHA